LDYGSLLPFFREVQKISISNSVRYIKDKFASTNSP